MRRRTSFAIAVVLAAASLLSAHGTPATAAATFTFYGSGNGHGIGMSQWGAYGLAKQGWTHQQILTHFYAGTAVRQPATLPADLRIGLATGLRRVHLTAQVGPVKIWVRTGGSRAPVATIPKGQTWVVNARANDYAIRDAAGALVGGKGWGGPDANLELTYVPSGARVFIPETDQIWGTGFAYGRGSIEFNLTSCGDANGCIERLVARLSLEDYLLGIGEVPTSWPVQALQAQAVAARTYAVYDLLHAGLRADCDCDLTDGAGDQTYLGSTRELGTGGARWVAAVQATAGEVVTYRGAVIQAFYAASDGGHSDSVQDVWHGGNAAYAIPWLQGVCDPGEWTPANPWTDWSKSFDAATLTARLAPYTGAIGQIVSFGRVVRADGGRIISVVANGAAGAAELSGTELRAGLGLSDDRVWINSDRNVTGALRPTYDALMCAPGLPSTPQRAVTGGAQQYFADGGLYRNTAKKLTVWLRGAIDAEYRAVGAAAGPLGVPIADVTDLQTQAVTCAGCQRIGFVGGRIYTEDGVHAFALWGPVLTAYLGAGGATGALGFPTARVATAADGSSSGAFEHGTISCPAGGAACTVTAT
ncbi:MAG TPA: SpoIID/LytB domain-containing protein [Actinomycetota bacterium]|nr:SpoIID/LytB domain-containing protein [Actinomycetota bacterium]